MSLVNNDIKLKFINDQRGFAFTATATVISIILGLTILFMVNTARTESLRIAEMHAAQNAYWEAMSDVQMAADMIISNGIGFIPTILANFPNITITAISATNYEITSTVVIGNARGGAERSASINITNSINYSMVEETSDNNDFEFVNNSEVDGGSLYIGNSIEFKAGTDIGADSLVNLYIPTGESAPGYGSYNVTLTHIAPRTLPTFDHTVYNNLLNLASSITVTNAAQGVFSNDQEWPDATKSTDINLQDPNFVYGGIFVNGDLIIDGGGGGKKGKKGKKGKAGIKIIDNNTAANPGFIVVYGKVEINDQKKQNSFGGIPDNVIIIALDDVKLDKTNFGESINYAPNTWQNYVNEIYTIGVLELKGDKKSRKYFGQFNVFDDFIVEGNKNNIRGTIYLPNSEFFGDDFKGRFDGSFYVKSTGNNIFGPQNDINLVNCIRLGRGLAGGINFPTNCSSWVISPGTIQEI